MIPLTERQGAVLEQALRLLVDGGEKALTTAGVARAASCSKESLYKWFGEWRRAEQPDGPSWIALTAQRGGS